MRVIKFEEVLLFIFQLNEYALSKKEDDQYLESTSSFLLLK
ncbi:hypothetical protein [Alkalihalobacterium alkalinitrilicum]|nr:hypothetical protein [Alkalihalobacterium alkalinitrilicum]